MVLMQIVTGMSKNQIRRDFFFQLLKIVLDVRHDGGEVAVAEIMNDNVLPGRAFQEKAGTIAGLLGPLVARTKHHPVKIQISRMTKHFEYRATPSDFDVIGMGAEAQNAIVSASFLGEL